MVIAKLIDGEGVDRGVHNFLVQTRSLQDHTLMPGVTCGDIGPKIGYNNMDNGFAKFDSVIIPRRNMAMRFATVDHKGIYEKKTVSDAASKISYITMMQVRSMIVMGSSKSLRMGTTMAIRYSAVRRQGFKSNDNDSKEENQILDYKQQQHFKACRKCSAN
jgi:acyl-CoA oxidase